MFDQAILHSIKKIAMPRLDCGIDGLEWNKVKAIIEEANRCESLCLLFIKN